MMMIEACIADLEARSLAAYQEQVREIRGIEQRYDVRVDEIEAKGKLLQSKQH
jgi:hypothetical protein